MDSTPRGTAVEAAPAIAKALNWPVANVETRARALQRHEPPGWPRPLGRGGGKNAAYATHWHGNNLVLSVATADAITPALMSPELVAAYRAIPVRDMDYWGTSEPVAVERPGEVAKAVLAWARALSVANAEGEARFRVIPGATLGEALDNLVDWISRPEGQVIRGMFRTFGMWVDLGVGYAHPVCQIGYATPENIVFRSSYSGGRGSWPVAKGASTDPGITGTNRVHFPVFETLADIWADSRPRMIGAPTLSPSRVGVTTADPESETPEPHHRAPAPTRTVNQPRGSHAAGHSHNPETKRVCLKNQGHGDPRGPFRKEPSHHEVRC